MMILSLKKFLNGFTLGAFYISMFLLNSSLLLAKEVRENSDIIAQTNARFAFQERFIKAMCDNYRLESIDKTDYIVTGWKIYDINDEINNIVKTSPTKEKIEALAAMPMSAGSDRSKAHSLKKIIEKQIYERLGKKKLTDLNISFKEKSVKAKLNLWLTLVHPPTSPKTVINVEITSKELGGGMQFSRPLTAYEDRQVLRSTVYSGWLKDKDDYLDAPLVKIEKIPTPYNSKFGFVDCTTPPAVAVPSEIYDAKDARINSERIKKIQIEFKEVQNPASIPK